MKLPGKSPWNRSFMNHTVKPRLTLLLAAPRGFCAGVDRAIKIVEQALKLHGAPVYVRHEIVHNRYVVDSLKAKGAVFVEELDEIPDTGRPVIFSAHGVAKSVPEEAARRGIFHIDAACPLVTKVHNEAAHHHHHGRTIALIGHAGHPEVIGTMGQLPPGAVSLIENEADARALQPADPGKLALLTQTTLSVDDTKDIIAVLKARFPDIASPSQEDICYATTNRQEAVQAIAGRCDAVIVMGAPNSSNSRRLVEVAQRAGCARAYLIERAGDIPFAEFGDARTLGITAGASAPEVLVNEAIAAIEARFEVSIEPVQTAEEDIAFNLPRELRGGAA